VSHKEPAPKIEDLDDVCFHRSHAEFIQALRTFPVLYNLTQRQLYEQAISEAFRAKGAILPGLLQAYAENLRRAVDAVMESPGYENRYFDLCQRLMANVTRFAAYKAWYVSRLLDTQRADSKGVERSEKDFASRARAILNTFNRYQVAEYNTASARTRTARQWLDFNDETRGAALFPNLRWLPSRSADPREEHAAFYNLVLPKADPFWKKNQPGNLWNCKCDWEETDEPASASPPDTNPHAEGLEGNPADTGEIFTHDASYFKTGEKHRDRVIADILDLKDDGFFEQKIRDTPVKVHILHGTAEVAGNMDVLAAFLKDRPDVKQANFLPNINKENINRRAGFYPKGHEPRGKHNNADAVIEFKDGQKWVVDFKAMQGNGGKLNHRLKDSYEQADYAIIKIKGTPKIDSIVKMADSFMKQHFRFKGLMVYDSNSNLIYDRQNK
jgi:hypothetical protein